MQTIKTLLFIFSSIVFVYGIYQLFRNNKVYKIRIKWIENDDPRHDYYSYDFMFVPSKYNWFGLKFPTDKAFPFL